MKKKFILLPLVVLALGACANGGDKPHVPTGPTFPDDPTYTDPVAAPVDKIEVGKVYKAGFYQATIKKQLYANGKTAEEAKQGGKQVNYYLATSENLKEATSWTFEQGKTANSYYVALKRNGTPIYLNMDEGNHMVLTAAPNDPVTEWTWNDKAKTIVTGTSFLGSYSDFETVSSSKTDFITKSGNFPLQFYEVGEAVAPTAVKVTANPTTVFAGQKSFIRTSVEPKFGKGEIELTATADGVAAEKLTIDALGNLKVDKTVPADTKVTVTAKCGTLTATAEITVKAYVDFGEEKPINVTKAKEALAAIGENAQSPCKMTVIGEVVSNDAYDSKDHHNYGSIVIKTGTDELTLFRTGYGKEDDKHSLDTLYGAADSMKGKMLTVTGTGANGEYEGKKYSRVQYGVIDSIEDKDLELAVATPKNNAEFYYGMERTTDPKGTYYLTGAKDGNYLATTKVLEEAKKVKTIQVEGGWNLQINGKFINIVQGDYEKDGKPKHFVGVNLEDAATTVWTFNEEHKIFTCVEEVPEWKGNKIVFLGTDNSKKFETVSTRNIDEGTTDFSKSYICQLYAEA